MSNRMPTGSIHTEIDIDAPPAAVWAVLADGPAYPTWNPFVKSLEGELVEGKRISVNIQPPGKGVSTFTPVLLKGEQMLHTCRTSLGLSLTDDERRPPARS